MSNNLNRLELPILLGAVADVARYRTMPLPIGGREYRDMMQHVRIIEARDGLARVDAARWLGFCLDSPALRMGISRAYASLQRRGLVERHACGFNDQRTTHLKPTEAGIALATTLTPKETTE